MPENIAAVIVNWNKKAEILGLLHDLRKIKEPLFDIFVVDNASTDGSSDAIEADFPEVNLIKNKINLGGTGGFNTGIDHVCKLDSYDYIWLLDNDVEVVDNTLLELVKVIKSDDRIGLVGSHVFDIDNREVTVEMGGNIRWDIMGAIPFYRNTTNEIKDSIVFVDYVAICSALVSVNAIKNVGLMDARLFLLWDDMDWGIYFKEHGYKVVAASKSIVYHGSFTERDRGALTSYYYGIRNPLLVYTKHTTFLKRARIFYSSLRYYSKIYFFLKSHYKKFEAGLIYKALFDYMNNRWGKVSHKNIIKVIGYQSECNLAAWKEEHLDKMLISAIIGITFQECITILKSLKEKYHEAEVSILTYSDRSHFFKNYKTYILDRRKIKNLFYVIKEFFAIKRKGFDAIAFVVPTPFIYLGKSSIMLDRDGNILAKNYTGPLSLIRLCLSVCQSEIVAFIILPVLLYKSLKYNGLNN